MAAPSKSGLLLLLAGIVIMALKCVVLLKWGAGKHHVPESDEA
ncbi:MAG: hypothetical protein ACOYM3_00310 [Terrimicrobiaceae bacterium]